MSHLRKEIAVARARGDVAEVRRMQAIEKREALAEHPGFGRVQGRIAGRLRQKDPTLSEAEAHRRAGAILASASRHASARAKARNPALKKV